jgi:hypothetical protein
MQTLILEPKNKKEFEVIKTIAEALKINFTRESDYHSPELDKSIKQARKEMEEGKLVTIDPANLWESI